jgi:hypothetical protein
MFIFYKINKKSGYLMPSAKMIIKKPPSQTEMRLLFCIIIAYNLGFSHLPTPKINGDQDEIKNDRSLRVGFSL